MQKIVRRTRSRVAGFVAVFFLGMMLSIGTAAAFQAHIYRTTSSQMNARWSYGYGVVDVACNQIYSCQNPTFPAQIYLKSTGGSTLRKKVGNCSLNYGHALEQNMVAWCSNQDWSPKYARCSEGG